MSGEPKDNHHDTHREMASHGRPPLLTADRKDGGLIGPHRRRRTSVDV